MPQSPTLTLTAAYEHTFSLNNGAALTAHADTRFFTKNYLVFTYLDPFPPFPPGTDVVPQATVSNASFSYASPRGKWNFEAWIKNIEDTPLKTGAFGPNLQLAGLPVRCVRPLFEVPKFDQVLHWHKYRDLDPGSQWLRDRILEAAQALPALTEIDG